MRTKSMKNPLQITVFKAKDGWRWHAKRCGRIVAEGGEAYHRQATLRRTLVRFVESLQDGAYVIVEQCR